MIDKGGLPDVGAEGPVIADRPDLDALSGYGLELSKRPLNAHLDLVFLSGVVRSTGPLYASRSLDQPETAGQISADKPRDDRSSHLAPAVLSAGTPLHDGILGLPGAIAQLGERLLCK
jgi:hypothetical protein